MARYLFLPVVVGLTYALHYYVWARLVRDPALPQPWRGIATMVIVLFALSMPLSMIIGRGVSREAAGWIAWPAFIWMGLLMFFTLLNGSADLVRLGSRLMGPKDPERRLFLHRVLGGAVVLLSGGLGALAVRGAHRVRLRELEVALGRLPAALDGTRLVQMTDIHIGPTLGREFLADLVRRTNALEPDIVAITGDLVDGSVEQLRDAVAPLAELRAKHGVYFVTGNHEYYAGVDEWMAELKRLGIRVLRNERVAIGGEHGFDLAGVDDHSAGRMREDHGPDVARAVAGRDPSRELILLAHQPKEIHAAARHGVGLQLSGHTHGGQIWPWKYLVRLQQPYVAGLVKHGPTQLYISPGTGYWGPPMRLGTEAELTSIVLRAPRRA